MTETEETTVQTVETTTADPCVGKTPSFLTGEYVKDKTAKRRPVALMYNNIINAMPHSGISNADVYRSTGRRWNYLNYGDFSKLV